MPGLFFYSSAVVQESQEDSRGSGMAAEQAVQGIQFSPDPAEVQLRAKQAGGCQSEPAAAGRSPGT